MEKNSETNQAPQNTPGQIPPAAPSELPTSDNAKKGKRKIFIGASLLAIVFIFLIASAVLSQILGLSKQVHPIPTLPTATPIPDPTANWKTYKDPDNSFSVRYPQKINEEDLQISFKLLTKQSSQALEAFSQSYINDRGSQLYDKSLLAPDAKTDIIVDGKAAIWYEGHLGPAAKHIEVYIQKNDKDIVVIEMYGGTNTINDDQRTLLNKILSTFKFTDSSEENQTVCTQEVKICPDGSYVGRQGPKCEFAPCL